MSNYRYTFGMIIFNGAEFLRQVLDSIYDFAHEIIIAEGADLNSRLYAKSDGSSSDETVNIIKNYPDPEKKISLIQGIWKDKIEQSNAWIGHATGDYVWQIDDDEIYKKEDLLKIDDLLNNYSETTAVSFHWCHFFGGVDRIRPVNPKTPVVWRLFKYKPGYKWHNHRPPDILDENGISLKKISPLMADELIAHGIYIYHFSYITNKQVSAKMKYMESVRLFEYNCGMNAHPHWKYYKYLEKIGSQFTLVRPIVSLWNFYFRWWKCRPKALELRKQADSVWDYDFYDKTWLAWKENPESVEGRGILSPNTGFYSNTVPFQGVLPKAVLSHPIALSSENRKEK